MKKTNIKYWIIIVSFMVSFSNAFTQTTIDQKLALYSNSGVNNGEFIVEYKLKGTGLTDAKTLGSLNADVIYDSTLIRFIDASNWTNKINKIGYDKIVSTNQETDFNRSLRIMITAPNVNNDSLNSQQGYDISNNYSTIVRLNFIILDNSKSVSLSIKSSTNQVGLFTNPGNIPNTFEIKDNLLSPPVTITNEPLPVMLTEFSSTVKLNNVSLKWSTSAEQNNSGFKIEKKLNTENNIWSEIGFVAGKGSTNSQNNYIYEDNNIPSGKYNYRLKQIDNNGNFKYYSLNNIVEIGLPSKYNLSQNYPNPFNPSTKINYELPKDSKVNIKIYDILGREVINLVNQEQKAGFYTITTDAKNLSSGTYFYRLIAKSDNKDIVMTKKMNVIK